MELSFAGPVVPVALGGIALSAALYEHAIASPDTRAAGEAGAAVAALSALATLLLGLPTAGVRAFVLAGLVTGAIWLAGRAARDHRLEPPLLCLVGLVVGLHPIAGLALAPFALAVVLELSRRGDRARALLRRAVVFALGAVLGLVLAVRDGAPPPSAAPALVWVSAAAHACGAAALALALGGTLLAFLGSGSRRTLASVAALLAFGDARIGHVGPLSCVALALGVGLALLEIAARLARERNRALLALLAPVVLIVVAEPVSARLDGLDWSPSLGPVPPRAPLAAPPSRPAALPPRRSPERRP